MNENQGSPPFKVGDMVRIVTRYGHGQYAGVDLLVMGCLPSKTNRSGWAVYVTAPDGKPIPGWDASHYALKKGV